MVLTTYRVAPGLKTAALDGALLVFHPGSGATVALTDQLLHVFLALQAGEELSELSPFAETAHIDTDTLSNSPTNAGAAADAAAAANETLNSCLRLLRQHQLILPLLPPAAQP